MPFVFVNDKKLFFYQASGATDGSANGLSVVAIHGLGSSHTFYLPLFDSLTKAGIQCIAYDTYGSAQSTIDRPSPYQQTLGSIARDTEALMDTLGLKNSQTILIGHSMGGMVASELASRNCYAGVVLLGPVHPNPEGAEVFARRIAAVKEGGIEAIADTLPDIITGSRSTGIQRAWIRAILLSQSVPGYVSLCSVLSSASAPDYGSIRSPILLMAGDEDKLAPLTVCKTILESCGTDATLKKLAVLQGVGHWHCGEAPDEIGWHVLNFVDSMILGRVF